MASSGGAGDGRQRIVLHGCSGSGKTTLARRLAERLDLPVIELDALFHQPDWTEQDPEAFRADVASRLDAAERDAGGWIVDGNYDSKLGDLVRARATTVVWFDLPRRVVMWRLVLRTVRRVVTREALWNGNRERLGNALHWSPERSILRWAWTRHAVYRERLSAAAASAALAGQTWVRIGSSEDADRVLARLDGRAGRSE